MRLAPDSRTKLEEFFREHFSDPLFRLPPIEIYSGGFTRMLTAFLKVHGITFGRRIFILPDLINSGINGEKKLSENLAAHEITHSVQYKRDGAIRFFYKYLTSYYRNLRRQGNYGLAARQVAYLQIPYEIEARETAESFVQWKARQKQQK
ncbi:MAG: DUF4157 domain-containing protein [Pyrinomonadaceae bacterium]|nr:DUF4157 domain-containing protein [Pyrinomonadaceae bacterium]